MISLRAGQIWQDENGNIYHIFLAQNEQIVFKKNTSHRFHVVKEQSFLDRFAYRLAAGHDK